MRRVRSWDDWDKKEWEMWLIYIPEEEMWEPVEGEVELQEHLAIITYYKPDYNSWEYSWAHVIAQLEEAEKWLKEHNIKLEEVIIHSTPGKAEIYRYTGQVEVVELYPAF